MNENQLAIPSLSLEALPADWKEVLAPGSARLAAISDVLVREMSAGHLVLPKIDSMLSAFTRPLSSVRVLIIGQDPYPTPGHAIGLSFSTAPEIRPVPRSLGNIYKELQSDLGVEPVPHGDLTSWADQGVLLLNRVLSVRSGEPGSHRGIGWEDLTQLAIEGLAERGGPAVAVLWGNDAKKVVPLLGGIPWIASPHPSPLSASRGFFGSKPFSRVNQLLIKQGAKPIDWRLPDGESSRDKA